MFRYHRRAVAQPCANDDRLSEWSKNHKKSDIIQQLDDVMVSDITFFDFFAVFDVYSIACRR